MTTEPSNEFVRKSFDLSQEFLGDSIVLLAEERLRSSIDRAYYSIHYGAVALLAKQGVRPSKSHRGLVNLFGREVVKRGIASAEFADMLSEALRHRSTSAYRPTASVTSEVAAGVVEDARRFLSRVQQILED